MMVYHRKAAFGAILLLTLTYNAWAFVLSPAVHISHHHTPSASFPSSSSRLAMRRMEMTAREGGPVDRRGMLEVSLASVLSGIAISTIPFGDSAQAASSGVVAVLGANGKTGTLCVKGLVERGIPTRAITRSGEFSAKVNIADNADKSLLSVVPGDVSKPDLLAQSLKGSSAVIYAASANFIKGTSTTQEVDNIGVITAGKVCIELGIPRLLVVSAGTVTRPKSFGYIATNLIGGIMRQKVIGEEGLRAVYANAPPSLSYTIVRPGGLDGKGPKGVAAIELNQGDTINGIVSREDLADVCIEALNSKSTENTTFELYETAGKKPVEGGFPKVSGKERKGSTWGELFTGLVPDSELVYPPEP